MLLINSVLQWPNFTWKRPGMVLRYKNRQYLRCWFSQYWPNELSVTSNRTKCLFGWWFWRKWNWKIRFRNESINEISLKNWIYTVSWSCGKKLLQLSLNYSLKVKKWLKFENGNKTTSVPNTGDASQINIDLRQFISDMNFLYVD